MKSVDHRRASWGLKAAAALYCLSLCVAAGPAAHQPASAQTAKPVGGQVAEPPSPPPMIQPTDDPAKVAAAREFIILYHPQVDPKKLMARLDEALPRMAAQAKKMDPELDEKGYIANARAHYIEGNRQSLERQSHVVSRHFTLQELKDLIAFCKSKLGQRLIVETMNIQTEMMLDNRAQRRATLKPGAEVELGPGGSIVNAKPVAPPHK